MSRSNRKTKRATKVKRKINKQLQVLITGSQGYIGTEALKNLQNPAFSLSGLDVGYYARSNIDDLDEIPSDPRDLRAMDYGKLAGVDCIVHLAALSNDPLGQLDPELTFEINRDCAIRIAREAKNYGVSRFIFASTQSIYGISDNSHELDEESQKNALTAYAKSKWEAEQEILALRSGDFCVTAVRPSTVFGWGTRMRNDIIFNNMIANGLANERIDVHSDGTPHRPVVHIMDVIDFLRTLITCPTEAINGEAFNLGMLNGNYSVKEIAEIASNSLGGIPIKMNTENLVDQRSYRVSFKKAKDLLGFEAKRDLAFGAREIVSHFRSLTSREREKFFNSTNRLQVLNGLIKQNKLDKGLRWL